MSTRWSTECIVDGLVQNPSCPSFFDHPKTLNSLEFSQNNEYRVHGVSRAACHKYKAATLACRVNGMHGNSGITRPRPHTIQAEANFTTIIEENADCMPKEFSNIGRKRVNNLLVLPSALNWDHMRDISNSVLHSLRFTLHFYYHL